jgi:tetratricopeptide (TPR) repeat protein
MRLVAVMLTVALSSASGNERAMAMLRDWIAAVDQHAAGESDAALSRISEWTYNDLELMRPYVEALAAAPTERNRDRFRRRTLISSDDLVAIRAQTKDLTLRGDFNTFRKRAAILHTDAALLGSPPVVVAPPIARQQKPRWARESTERSVIVRSFDGRVEDFVLKNPHWDFAMDMLDALPAEPRDPIVAQWYRGIGAYFADTRSFADALQHFARARAIVPDDPHVMFGEACLNETLGAPRIQNYVQVTTLPNGLFIRGVDAPATHWKRAESLLRRAVAIDPAFVEARLRLGRVLIQQQKLEEGLGLVEQAAAASSDRVMRYYGYLFAGDALLALGRAGDARESYQRAVVVFPDGQAARLGLGSALRALSDGAEALDAMLPTLTKDPSSRAGDDPWWEYYDGDAARVESLLEQLRAPFREPRR